MQSPAAAAAAPPVAELFEFVPRSQLSLAGAAGEEVTVTALHKAAKVRPPSLSLSLPPPPTIFRSCRSFFVAANSCSPEASHLPIRSFVHQMSDGGFGRNDLLQATGFAETDAGLAFKVVVKAATIGADGTAKLHFS